MIQQTESKMRKIRALRIGIGWIVVRICACDARVEQRLRVNVRLVCVCHSVGSLLTRFMVLLGSELRVNRLLNYPCCVCVALSVDLSGQEAGWEAVSG